MDHFFIYFLKGMAVGASVAAPIGPVAIYCMQQTLSHGLLYGLAAGTAVSIADAFYSWVAAYGSTYIERLIHSYETWFCLFGGCFLLYLSYTIFKAPVPSSRTKTASKTTTWATFSKTLILTFASPMTTLLFIGMFTAYGVFKTPLDSTNITGLVIGVGIGAMAWWIVLTSFVNYVHGRYSASLFKYVNYISATCIMGYGLYTLGRLLKNPLFS